MEGYDVETLQEISNDLYCMICLKLMRNPVQFKCGHGMCHSCYKYLSRKARDNRYGGEPCCPQCREIIKDQFVFSNTMLHRLILSIQIKCTNETAQCDWVGEISSLEDHLESCCSVIDKQNIGDNKSTRNFVKQNNFVGSHCEEILSAIVRHLGIIETKLDKLSANSPALILTKKSVERDQHTLDTMPTNKKTTRKKTSYCRIKDEQHEWNFKLWFRIAILVAFSLVLIWMTSIAGFWMTSSTSNTTLNSESLKQMENVFRIAWVDVMNEAISRSAPNFTSNVASETPVRLLTLLHDVNNKLRSLSKKTYITHHLMSHVIAMKVDDMRTQKERIDEEILLFYEERNRSLVSLDKKLFIHIEQSRQKINRNISLFEDNAVLAGAVENVITLEPLLTTTMSYLNGYIFPEIDIHHAHSIELAKLLAFKVNLSLHSLKNKIDRNIFNSQKNEMFLKQSTVSLIQLKHNASRDCDNIDELRFVQVVSSEIEAMRIRYDYVLSGYYANISRAISYKERFRGLLLRYTHYNFTPGMYVWKLNTSQQIVDYKHAYVSETFASLHKSNATLLFYKDISNEGFWKITFSQQEYEVNVNVTVTILNHLIEEKLICFSAVNGEMSHRNTAKLHKFFTIPISWNNMVEKGYIVNDIAIVKVQVTNLTL